MGKNTQANTLESLVSGGLFGGQRKHTVGGKLLNSLGVESVLYDSNRSEIYYASEASKLLGEASQLATYADTVMESMKNNIRLVADMKKKYAIENLDPVSFALENEATGASKVGFFKKVWDTIVEVFRRLVLAVANFVKQIQVWISGPIAKAQSDFYTKNKDAIVKGLSGEAGKQKLTAMKVITDPVKVLESTKAAGAAAAEGADKLIGMAGTFIGSKDLKKDLTEHAALYEKITAAIRTAGGAVTKTEKTLPGKDAAMKAVFGVDAKPAQIEISALFSAADFEALGKKGFDEVVKIVNDGKKSAAQLAKLSGMVKTLSQKAVKLAAGNKEEVEKAQALTTLANNVKKYQAVQVNMLFGGFSVYMRYRGYLYTAAKILAKGEKKAAKATPAAK